MSVKTTPGLRPVLLTTGLTSQVVTYLVTAVVTGRVVGDDIAAVGGRHGNQGLIWGRDKHTRELYYGVNDETISSSLFC